MDHKKAVLIGHNFNSLLGLARALGPEGYEVNVIRTGAYAGKNPLRRIGQTPEAHSKYITKYRIAQITDSEKILHILTTEYACTDRKAVLIPVDDLCAKLIDEHMDELRPCYYMPNVDDKPGGVVRLMDKFYQNQLAKEAGLPVPESWSIKIKDGKFRIPDDITYPCFAKAEMPMRARKNYMGKCENRQQLTDLLQKAADYQDCMMIVEEYVEIGKEYCIVGVCGHEAVLIPDVIDELVLGHGEHAGVTCYGHVMKPEALDPDFIAHIKTFLRLTHFTGLFTIDVFQSGDKLFFGELNLRIGGSGIAIIGAGVNIARIAADILQGNNLDDPHQECNEITFASERPLVNDLTGKYITRDEYRSFLRNADFRFVHDRNDMAPYYWYGLFVTRERMKHIVRQYKAPKAGGGKTELTNVDRKETAPNTIHYVCTFRFPLQIVGERL